MRFGINFFPAVGPGEKTGAQYYDECLLMAERAEELGYHHVKTVEHYFREWGGYTPDPVPFLTAVAMRTTRVRLVTGAVIPAFDHPIKLAGKLSMLDNLSHGRLDVGFARAFLPDEFAAFQTSMDESRPRFEEGIDAVKLLWTSEGDTRWEGRFHRFGPLPALLPRPYPVPHPPIFSAVLFDPESFAYAGRNGYHLMLVPSVSTPERVAEMLHVYRAARAGGAFQPGTERIQLGLHCVVHEERLEAERLGKVYFEDYKEKQVRAISAWRDTRSEQYPGYERLIMALEQSIFEGSLEEEKVLVGDPDRVCRQVGTLRERYGDVELSLQVNFGNMPLEDGMRTVELFGREILPRFA